MGQLTTHVLDTATGAPASGIPVELFALEAGQRRPLAAAITNQDGRTNAPLLTGDAFRAGRYELVFQVADYFRQIGATLPEPAFLDTIPLQFAIADASAHYHVPLLVSPWAYSTYRGS